MEATHPRVVLVHDWLTGMRGGEKCLEVVCQRWPQAQLRTLLYRKGSVSPAIEALQPRASWLQGVPGIFRLYRYFLPLFPAVIGSWRLPECDLVVSFSHCVAKSIRPPRRDGQLTPHVCYCFTPMRYAWHMKQAYFGQSPFGTMPWSVVGLKARMVDLLLDRLRRWDRATASRVSHFIAISRTVQQRIAECYGRDSVVIYPPVDTDFYCPAPVQRQDFYLIVSAFAPYKRLDLAIDVCNRLRRRLVIIGTGQDEAAPPVAGWSDRDLPGLAAGCGDPRQLRLCRALLFPGEEDFGIVPLEAHGCGTPVLALGKGGATETVIPPGTGQEPTGVWFEEPTADCLADALLRFESHPADYSPDAARRQALLFQRLPLCARTLFLPRPGLELGPDDWQGRLSASRPERQPCQSSHSLQTEASVEPE